MDKKPIILIADDDPQALGVLEQIMIGNGYEVITAGEGHAAREKIFSERPRPDNTGQPHARDIGQRHLPAGKSQHLHAFHSCDNADGVYRDT